MLPGQTSGYVISRMWLLVHKRAALLSYVQGPTPLSRGRFPSHDQLLK